MTKLGLISDSHGAAIRLAQFTDIATHEKFDAVLCCGDGVSDYRSLSKKLSMPVYFVAGNCDYQADVPWELQFDWEGVHCLIVHGHLFASIRYDLTALSYRADEVNAQVVFYGHTHIPKVDLVGKTMFINPGALKDGRYAVIEIENGAIRPKLMEL
ncbi:MAG: metallophosphoesterase [Clostridia bacterium]|nr:metallophosphoesterase [Clostridia bacterium]